MIKSKLCYPLNREIKTNFNGALMAIKLDQKSALSFLFFLKKTFHTSCQ